MTERFGPAAGALALALFTLCALEALAATSACASFRGEGGEGGEEGGTQPSTLADPSIVATALGAFQSIACDADAAYVIVTASDSDNRILRIDKAGGIRSIVEGQFAAKDVVVDDARIYFIVGGPSGGHTFVRSTPKLGGGAEHVDLLDSGYGAQVFASLTKRGTALAVAATTGGGTVLRGEITGSFAEVAKNAGMPRSLGIAGAYVYWITSSGENIYRATSLEAGAPEVFAKTTSATSLAIAGSEVLWTSDEGSLSALAVDKPNGAVRVVASVGLSLARRLAVDSERAYWVDTDNGNVASVALAGGTPQVVAKTSSGGSLAVCDNAIWVANAATGDVSRLERR